MPFKKYTLPIWVSVMLAASSVNAETPAPEDEVFARVGATSIMVSEYKQALISSSRDMFYHGTPPEAELLAFQQKVADQIISRELLLLQARQLGLEIDGTLLEKELDKHRQRAQRRSQIIDEESESWQSLRLRSQQDLLTKELENNIRQGIPIPTEDEQQTYYQTNADKFTEPARFDLSTILLGVAPAAGAASWDAARQEAHGIVLRLRAGADFAELARIHSADVSAADGGALGYSHKGMFSASAQEVIEKLRVGEISEPLQILEGIAILRLNSIQAAKLVEFSQVKKRVKELWLREEGDRHWQDYLETLRKNTSIDISEKYLSLSGNGGTVPENADKN